MPFEIERKFLVTAGDWRDAVSKTIRIRQAYLASDGKVSIRVRIKNDHEATLTIKSREAARRRLELEYAIPALEAEALMALRRGTMIVKTRHLVFHAGETWEVDVFEGDSSGLIIAEIELRNEDQEIDLPAWVGPELTGQPSHYHSSLALRPFGHWNSAQVSSTR